MCLIFPSCLIVPNTLKGNVMEIETHLIADFSVKVSGNLLDLEVRYMCVCELLMLKKVLSIPCCSMFYLKQMMNSL